MPVAQVPSGILARLLSIVGHVAFKQLYHLDVSINNELKRRENIQEEKKGKKKSDKGKKRKSKDKVPLTVHSVLCHTR